MVNTRVRIIITNFRHVSCLQRDIVIPRLFSMNKGLGLGGLFCWLGDGAGWYHPINSENNFIPTIENLIIIAKL